MGLDINNKKTEYFVDDYGLMLTQNPNWNPNSDNGKGDCIGRTLDAYVAYNKYEPFVKAVKECFKYKFDKNGKKYIQGYRHPTNFNDEYNDMSRDHILNTLILMKLSDNNVFLNDLSKYLKWKISDRYSFTLELWLWMKGITGNKFAMFLYYLIDIIILFFGIFGTKLIYRLGGFGKEIPQDKFIQTPNELISNKKRFYRKLVYPIYTLYQKSFMMYVSPNSLGKKIVKKMCLWIIDEQNFLLKLMFGGVVNKENVYSYKSMTCWRWSTYLNEMNNRELKIITDSEKLKANVLDVDLLIKIYEESK